MIQKLIFSTAIIFLLVTSFYSSGSGQSVVAMAETNEIVTVMDKNDIDVEKWAIYARENWGMMSMDELENRFSEMEKADSTISWKIEKNSDTWKAVGIRVQQASEIEEEILLFGHPHESEWEAYIVYKASGKQWNKTVEEAFDPVYAGVVETFFKETPRKFTCVTGLASDMMEGVLNEKAARIVKDFNGKEVESLIEETFVSVSAYTSKWKNEIPAKNGKMNLQVAIREGMGGVSTVTIGTPIITSEY